MSIPIDVTANTTKAERTVQEFQATTNAVTRNQILAMRRGVELGILGVQALGVVLDQTLQAQIRVAAIAIETAIAVNAATSIKTAGIQLGFGAIQVVLLAVLINNIERGRTEIATQMQYNVTILRQTGVFIGR